MKKNKKPQFFCEHCGAEVPENAKFCKKCGKFFISVRCPQCGASGMPSLFKKGCPECGYAVNGSHGGAAIAAKNAVTAAKPAARRRRPGDAALPVWVYVFTGLLLVAIVCASYSCIYSLN